MNRLKSKACKGFLFYLNHDDLVYLSSSLAKIQHLRYVSVIFGEERKQLIIIIIIIIATVVASFC